MIKIIGFDLDQTLYPKSPEVYHIVQYQIFKEIARIRKCELKEAEELFKKNYKKLKSGSNTIIKILTVSIEEARSLVQRALAKADIDHFLIPNKEVNSLLEDLKEKYHLDLITGSAKNNMLYKMKKLCLPKVFGHCISGEEWSKSSGEAYEQWIKLRNLEPENFLYIGDEEKRDYYIPRKLGIRIILVNVEKRNRLIKCPQLSSILELRSILL